MRISDSRRILLHILIYQLQPHSVVSNPSSLWIHYWKTFALKKKEVGYRLTRNQMAVSLKVFVLNISYVFLCGTWPVNAKTTTVDEQCCCFNSLSIVFVLLWTGAPEINILLIDQLLLLTRYWPCTPTPYNFRLNKWYNLFSGNVIHIPHQIISQYSKWAPDNFNHALIAGALFEHYGIAEIKFDALIPIGWEYTCS